MKIIFSNRPKSIGSKLIRLVTRVRGQSIAEIPSHVSMCCYESMLVEAVAGKGVILNYLPTFLKHSKIIAVYEFKSRERDHVFYRKVADIYHGQGYDYIGAFWFAWILFVAKVLGRTPPKVNNFQSKKRAFCNEILGIILNEETSQISPNHMMMDLDKDERFIKVKNA